MKGAITTAELDGGRFRNTAVTIGVFDGVHIGHQQVAATLQGVARGTGASASVVVTFDRHPAAVTRPEDAPPLLTTLDEKLSLIARTGVDWIVVETFDRETAAMDYRTYIEKRLLGGLGMSHLVVGHDFRLGRGRGGGEDRLAEESARSGFGLTVVPPVKLGGRTVSSTTIREDIGARRFDEAARALTRPYFLDGDVVRGDGRGAGLGFPTANVAIPDPGKLVPPAGVYAVLVDTGEQLADGMLNIGSAPTFHEEGETRIEVNLFDFDGDLYGRRLRVHFVAWIREERRFADAGALAERLARDREAAARILHEKKNV